MQGLPDDTVVVIDYSGDVYHCGVPFGVWQQDVQQLAFQFKGCGHRLQWEYLHSGDRLRSLRPSRWDNGMAYREAARW
jgi:hypothetical protein